MNLCNDLLLSSRQFPGPSRDSWTIIKDVVMHHILTASLQMISDYSSLFVPSQFLFPRSARSHSASSQSLLAAQLPNFWSVCVLPCHHCSRGQPRHPKARRVLGPHLGGIASIPKRKGSRWLSRPRDESLALYLYARAPGSRLPWVSVGTTRGAL